MKTLLATILLLSSCAKDDFAAERAQMVAEIQRLAASTGAETGRSSISPRVLAAIAAIPRHAFVPADQIASAYRNRPLPIGHRQTISQPYIVALMTDLAQVSTEDTVLEIGTGSGYQAAILSRLAKQVYTIELIEGLGREAAQRLRGYANVTTRIGDGYRGWPEAAPFDAIIVTAAPDHVPPALIAQLKPGGRMVVPVGTEGSIQQLTVVEKDASGRVTESAIVPVRFVPLVKER